MPDAPVSTGTWLRATAARFLSPVVLLLFAWVYRPVLLSLRITRTSAPPPPTLSVQMAAVMTLTIGVSVLYSLGPFVAMLALVGPAPGGFEHRVAAWFQRHWDAVTRKP